MADARRFIYSSDYPMQYAVYYYEGTMTGGSTKTVAHGLPFTPLLIGEWSTSSDFSSANTYLGGGYSTEFSDPGVYLTSNATNCNYSTINASGTGTIYLRTWGFMPPDTNADVADLADFSGFDFDSDYSYQKLYIAGKGASNATINHNLGYKPRVRIWNRATSSGTVSIGTFPSIDKTSGGLDTALQITENTIILPKSYPASPREFYYFIFEDEA